MDDTRRRLLPLHGLSAHGSDCLPHITLPTQICSLDWIPPPQATEHAVHGLHPGRTEHGRPTHAQRQRRAGGPLYYNATIGHIHVGYRSKITSIWLIVHFQQPMKMAQFRNDPTWVGPILRLMQRPLQGPTSTNLSRKHVKCCNINLQAASVSISAEIANSHNIIISSHKA